MFTAGTSKLTKAPESDYIYTIPIPTTISCPCRFLTSPYCKVYFRVVAD